MLIFPAIDLQGGRCVRLTQGDFARAQEFSDDPAAVARRWQSEGACWLHVVDLDGARAGAQQNLEAIKSIRQATSIPMQVGGGLRSPESVAALFDLGIQRAILGTAALKDRDFLCACLARWGERIAVGLDARDGLVATDGWLETSTTPALTLAQELADERVARFIYTDIARDGTLGGPNLKSLAQLQQALTQPIIASGGVASLADLQALAALRVEGAIVGRALYTGEVKLAEAIAAAEDPRPRRV
ncbi:MAG TPA: 1-(5-phosphoribosyl)-5-[(5-phosphoribosylamino)methylideneamino]imidazole-4-carboxamide isomerase [Ktedonobacterales bacterium]|nr:1-(5-phosphoribosyl)-5-[(5-phosphoribosylamino)methylideneamino]imidazole-4-carboxamide isomerase [Ktedonobacterales bacterium]